VDVLLTCDTGIAAHESVKLAHSRMVDVVITDHHTLPDSLPDAEAVINPMRLPEGHPLRELPGVGTAYQLARALYGAKSSDHLLDLVAVGIVADVMVLVDDTRYWLQRGLDVLRNDPRPGLRAMMERADIQPSDLTETDIGFTLAPRLNALGRLADANPAVELLTTGDTAIIAERVNELEGLNQKRRFLTQQVYEAAQRKIQDNPDWLRYAALVVSGEGWHTGVAGIVASRLADDYACPVIVFSENEGIASGSARSVAGCNIVEAIRTQAGLLNTYGGHNMAAGLSLPADKIFEFRRGLSGAVRESLGTAEVQPQIAIDAYVNLSEIDLNFADDIARLAPFGNGNPPLTLATKNVHVKSRRTLGRRGDHLDLRLEDESGHEARVVWWFGDVDAVPEGKFDLAYTVRANVYNGKREALIEWLDARPVDGWILRGGGETTYSVVDCRGESDPQTLLRQVQTDYPDVLVWREGTTEVDGADRYHLRPAQTLVVWTIPPDPSAWEAALNVVQPQNLILFAERPAFATPQTLLTHLTGLLKFAHRAKNGQVSAGELAAFTGQTEATIRACFKWLTANTEMTLAPDSEDMYRVEIDPARIPPKSGDDLTRLKLLFTETNAYREYWRKQNF
jgi:single-stranded-DNA-specific exonuclease